MGDPVARDSAETRTTESRTTRSPVEVQAQVSSAADATCSTREPGARDLIERYLRVRADTDRLASRLSDEDLAVQVRTEASPVKWHLAHTTWLWETFLLRDHSDGYTLFDDRYPFLFNSYYEAEGARIARGQRGMLSRPSLDEILEWRHAARQDRLSPVDIWNPLTPNEGTPNWNVVDLHLGWDLRWGYAMLGISNLLNESYFFHGSGVGGLGRLIIGSVKLGF